MDLSKLPKLSDSSQSQPPPPPMAETAPMAETTSQEVRPAARYRPAPSSGVSGDVWFNVVVGMILLFLGRNFLFWAMATLTGQPFHTHVNWTDGPNNGQEVSYFDLQGFTALTETGMFLFGVAILFEAAVVALEQIKPSGPARALVMLALGLTVLCTLFNLFVSIRLMSVGVVPLMSGLAVAFGGYMIVSIRGVLQNS
jgi:hypothetical protein